MGRFKILTGPTRTWQLDQGSKTSENKSNDRFEAHKKAFRGIQEDNRQANGEWILTKEGEIFASIAQRCNREIGTLENEVQAESPEVTITTTEFIAEHILTPQISNILSSKNDLTVTLDMRDVNVSLAYGEADLAIRLGRPTSGKLVSSKLADIQMNLFSKGGKLSKRWFGLPAQFDWVPEMQLALDFFGCQPVVRVGSFASIRDIAVKHDLACVGPTFMMNGWQDLKILDHFNPAANREVWSVFHESRRHDEALNRARHWARDCFRSLPENTIAPTHTETNAQAD